jgi:hypothetical protein
MTKGAPQRDHHVIDCTRLSRFRCIGHRAGFAQPLAMAAIMQYRCSRFTGPSYCLGAGDAASFTEGEGSVLLRAMSEGAQVVLLAGRPLCEPTVSHGPFVMNTQQQIAEAFERYHAGGMGTLVPANGT